MNKQKKVEASSFEFLEDGTVTVKTSPVVYSVSRFSVRLVRESNVTVDLLGGERLSKPSQIAIVAERLIGQYQQEHLIVMFLTTKLDLMGYQVVAIGNGNSVIVNNGEIFRSVLLSGCTAFAIAHNHPSGDCLPSPEDLRVTEGIARLSRELDLSFLDHLIVSSSAGAPSWYSFRENFSHIWQQ